MTSPHSEFDLLLPVIDPVTADLAQDLLKSRGIPSVLKGPDFDVAELGVAAHRESRHQDLYVPQGTRATARNILVEAWGEVAVAAHERGDEPPLKELGAEE